MHGERKDSVDAMLRCLTLRQRLVIVLHYGLGRVEVPGKNLGASMRFVIDGEQYGKAKTLDEVGQILNISSERVRQIKVGAIRKIQESPHTAGLQLRRLADAELPGAVVWAIPPR